MIEILVHGSKLIGHLGILIKNDKKYVVLVLRVETEKRSSWSRSLQSLPSPSSLRLVIIVLLALVTMVR